MMRKNNSVFIRFAVKCKAEFFIQSKTTVRFTLFFYDIMQVKGGDPFICTEKRNTGGKQNEQNNEKSHCRIQSGAGQEP